MALGSPEPARPATSARATGLDPLLDALGRALDRLVPGPACILVAVSGGVDSSVLAAALTDLAPARGLRLHVGHVHHGLRGAEADADRAASAALAARLGLPFRSARVDPVAERVAGPSRTRPTLQEAARRLRYRALERLADEAGAERIATAHTADDQAETVLLRLLRGCSPAALAGIPPLAPGGRVVRPLLAVSRSEVEAWAERHQVAWREDGSNRDRAYARNRLRHDWLPGLAGEFNPRLLRTLAQLAEAQREENEWLEVLEAEAAAGWIAGDPLEGELQIRRDGWSELAPALALRLLRRAWRQLGGARDVSRVHLRRMRRFVSEGRPGRELELPGGLRMVCRSDTAALRRPRVERGATC